MPEVSDDDLGLLVWCAISFDRKLPGGYAPPGAWDALSDEWRHKINKWNTSDRDGDGAEIRRRDED
jgi:hypothetical protein